MNAATMLLVSNRQRAEKKDDEAIGDTGEDAGVEVGRDRLRGLEDRENLRQIKIAEIRWSIEKSRRDDRSTPADEVLSRLKAKYVGISDKTEAQGGE
jgi:antitoxin ParD1/3/4